MYYEIFIDVLFTMNYVMDFFLLRLVNRLLHSSATLGRSLLGALIGAGGVCLLAIHPGSRIMNTILVHVVINTLMVRFGCKLKKIRELVKGILVLYMAAFLLGGMMMLVQRYSGSWGIRVCLFSGTISYLFLVALASDKDEDLYKTTKEDQISYAVTYGEFMYQAGSWEYPRRVVFKIENPYGQFTHMYTFIVTNMDMESY